ncbi:uncharacterized protein LOC123535010 [Mercenaria mercenaria]|uniref:uncharacterized protein LOC123535010 n=1 Tax=Mercenaria mercenaria TaxID=6596 RepID=UPI00234F9D2C|nr:uncharacterized protein LOC123535010 [Mercenaria mercenaria]
MQMRDIRELTNTSDKNREILTRVRAKGVKGYFDFKKCLIKSRQECLVKYLDTTAAKLEEEILPAKETSPTVNNRAGFKCSVCDLSFGTVQHLVQHTQTSEHLNMIKEQQEFAKENQEENGDEAGDFSSLASSMHEQNAIDSNDQVGQCFLCNVRFTSPSHANSHLSGKKHKRRKALFDSEFQLIHGSDEIKSVQLSSENVGEPNSQLSLSLNTLGSINPTVSVDSSKTCDICNVSFTSKYNAQQHYDSEKHKKKALILQKQKLGEALPMSCDICNCSFNGPESAEAHFKSEKHRKMKDKKQRLGEALPTSCNACNCSFSTPESAEAHFKGGKHRKAANKAKTEGGDGLPLFCTICSCPFSSELNAKQHFESKKHKRKQELNAKTVPEELMLNPRDIAMYLKALEEGKERDKCVRIMVVGHYAQGKTSLTRRLFGQTIERVESTNGIEVHSKQCQKIGSHWDDKPSVEDDMTNRLVKVALLTESLNENEKHIDDISGNSLGAMGKQMVNEIDVAALEMSREALYKTEPMAERSVEKNSSVELIYDKDSVAQFAQKMNANKKRESTAVDEDTIIDINVWDFGGQFIYYATHQIFHSRNAIYLLVFNLKEPLDNILIDEDFPNNQFTMKSSLTYWMESIHSFVGSQDGKEPVVILVGTHKGDCTGNENKQLEAAMEILCTTKTFSHVYPSSFAVECMDPHDESLEQLRNVIYKVGLAKTQHRLIPAKWIPLEKKLLELRNKKIIRLEDVQKLDSENSHPIQDEEHVKLFLKYHAETGSLIFFDEEKLQDFVVLDPQFLIDAFKCIITSKRFFRLKPNLHHLGRKLITSGVLEMDLLDEVWGNDETNQFYAFKDVIIAFMQRLRIFAEIKDINCSTGSEQNGNVSRCFLVPSLLKCKAEEEVMKAFLPPCKRKSNVSLVLELENSSVLPLIYQRVTAAVLAKWPPIYFPRRDPLLFQDVGAFLLNHQHAGLLTLSKVSLDCDGLEITVVNLCPTSTVDSRVCEQFRRYIEMVILLEFEKFSSSSKDDLYRYYLRCNHFEHGYKGSFYVHDLKQVRGDKDVHCPDHGSHVVNVKESIGQWFKKETTLSDESLPDRELTDKELSKIAQAIGKNWNLLGIDLGLGQDDIDRCEIDHCSSGVKTTIYFILKEWKKRCSGKHSMKYLITQMKECEGLTVNWDKINNLTDNF